MIVSDRLSASKAKRRLYAEDPHFRAGYISFANAVGMEAVADFTWPLASVILKPESLAGRTALACCMFLFAHGFVPLAATAVHLSSLAVREIWRYQINVATEERLYAMDRIFASGPSVFLVLRRPQERESAEGASASSMLNEIKGPSEPSKRKPWHLRASIGAAPSRLLTHVHVAEEPADVIRDVGVLFDEPQRRGLLQSIPQGEMKQDEVIDVVNDAASAYPEHDLDPTASVRRLRQFLKRAASQDSNEALALASSWLDSAEQGVASDWHRFITTVDLLDIDFDVWDLITVGSDVMTMDQEYERRLLD